MTQAGEPHTGPGTALPHPGTEPWRSQETSNYFLKQFNTEYNAEGTWRSASATGSDPTNTPVETKREFTGAQLAGIQAYRSLANTHGGKPA